MMALTNAICQKASLGSPPPGQIDQAGQRGECDQTVSHLQQVATKTGNVLSALEIFTFANFNSAEREDIFNRARTDIEKHESENGPITER